MSRWTPLQELQTPVGVIHVGTVVVQKAFTERRRVLVTKLHRRVKDGLPGFSGEIVGKPDPFRHDGGDARVWGYSKDVVAIERST